MFPLEIDFHRILSGKNQSLFRPAAPHVMVAIGPALVLFYEITFFLPLPIGISNRGLKEAAHRHSTSKEMI
jgi:hypothetical protein